MWSKNNNFKFTYDDQPKISENQIGKYAKSLVSSDFDKFGSKINGDYNKILNNGCVYLPNFFCGTNDKTIFNNLKKEISENKNELTKWSKHFKYEDPTFSKTFNEIVEKMAKKFNVKVVQTRLNFYKDGQDWKPFHKDSHAYGNLNGEKIKEDFTMGASFGESRILEIKHDNGNDKFSFPQNNGDVFAFTGEINKTFLHGIPKEPLRKEPRFSIIAWGKKM